MKRLVQILCLLLAVSVLVGCAPWASTEDPATAPEQSGASVDSGVAKTEQAQDADRLLRLYTAVNHPNYRYLCDIGNFVCADENSAVSVGKMKELIAHVHVKDFFIRSGMEPDPGRGWFQTRAGNYIRGTVFGQGNIPALQCLRIIKKSGYDGYISLEFEGMEDPLTGIEIGYENMKRYIAILEA